jgi:hypothetical protein
MPGDGTIARYFRIMVDVITNIVINASQKTVSEFASNPDNARRWYVNIKSVV